MLYASTLQLLRFHFSFFLLPVYVFALSQAEKINAWHAVLIFFILHLLVYPSSNGYNSYIDRDTGPVGGIRSPSLPTRQLYHTSVVMDILALLLSLLVSLPFTIGVAVYIAASKAYSSRLTRLKKYPFAGYLTVVIFQGAWTFYIVYTNVQDSPQVPYLQMMASSLLIGGFYPLTQVYQHEQDRQEGVTTLSMVLGKRGTFVFTAIIYLLAFACLFILYSLKDTIINFYILMAALFPVLAYFFLWASRVWKDGKAADFDHTMKMNMLASFCTNLAFIIILTRRFF